MRLPLGRDIYQVVGITEGLLASGGDSAVFFTRADAQSIQYDKPNEANRLDRESRSRRVRQSELGRDPQFRQRALGPADLIPALSTSPIAAVLIDLAPGADLAAVRDKIGLWRDVTIYSQEEQDQLILGGVVEKTKKQIGLFRGLLVIISAILMSLIIYTMTVDKIHSIALLKLLGAKAHVIIGMILQEALLLGGIAYGIALVLGNATFHRFPRRVVIDNSHRLSLLGIVILISVAASIIGMRKALAADPNEVLAS
jgi:putative ABC transport system permease protein